MSNVRVVNYALIVDDHEDIRTLMEMVLKGQGFEPILATNGREALEILQNSNDPFFLLITDYNMPYMNGGELVTEIMKRKIDIKKIIIMSGAIENQERINVIQEAYPQVKYLQKPAEVSAICNLISEQ